MPRSPRHARYQGERSAALRRAISGSAVRRQRNPVTALSRVGRVSRVFFAGQVADYYAHYRRGYPPAVIARLVKALGVGPGDLIADLGCGTGQLAIPLARHVRHVLGIDPEADMLRHARAAAHEHGAHAISWLLASDTDLPTSPT